MSNRDLLVALAMLQEWQVPARMAGSAALLYCADKALRYERSGRPWTPMGVCMEAAQELGRTQRNMWENMVYALRRSHGPRGPGAALRAIVAMGKEVEADAANAGR